MHIYDNEWMCIYSVLINNHCPIVYYLSQAVLSFCVCIHLQLSSTWWKRVQLRKCMNWSVSSLRLREMNCLWAEPPYPPTASPSLLHLPASCFKLPVAFCSCSFICSKPDTKACRRSEEDPTFITQMGGSLPHTGPCGITPPSTYEQQFRFFLNSCVF